MEYIEDLKELCETISNEIADANEKIRSTGGKLTGSDIDYIDKLTHSMKSIKAVISMMEDEGYSSNGMSYRDSYRGGSYGSYARGRRNARRDSMGRYASEGGYSRHGDLVEELHQLMADAPNDQIRHDLKRLADKLEQM